MNFDCFPASFRRHETERIVVRRQDALLEEHKAKMMQELAAPFDFGQNLPEIVTRKKSRKVSISLEDHVELPIAKLKDINTSPQKDIQSPLKSKVLKVKSAGYSIGKQPDNCEDAFFVCERGFGVADGVSGWNDYGFSSHAFSTQLMEFCQQEIEKFDLEAAQMASEKIKFKK